MHLRLALAVGKPLKYLKTTLKRALSSLPPPTSPLARSGVNLASSVQLALFGSRLEKEAPNEALAAWRNIKQVAQEVENRQLWVVATLAEARLGLLIEGDLVRAASLLAAVHGDLGDDAATTAAVAGAWPPRQLRVMYRLVYCLVHSQLGNVKEAKDMLKATHQLLDAKMDAAEAARPDAIPVSFCCLSRVASFLTRCLRGGNGRLTRAVCRTCTCAGRDQSLSRSTACDCHLFPSPDARRAVQLCVRHQLGESLQSGLSPHAAPRAAR